MFVCLAATMVAAQSTAPSSPAPSTPQATPATPAPAVPAHVGRHARKGPALRDINDPRAKELIAKHHAEKKACRKNSAAPGCADLATRQKAENRDLRQQLRKEGKI